jgi:hypothetical protein
VNKYTIEVPSLDWGTTHRGQIVRMSHDIHNDVIGQVGNASPGSAEIDGAERKAAYGWRLFVTATEMPTESGLYVSSKRDSTFPWIFQLREAGAWWLLNTNSMFPIGDGHLEQHAPFTRLYTLDEAQRILLDGSGE